MTPLKSLTDWREAKHLSRRELAERLDVTETTIWRWEAGERRPARRIVPLIARLTRIPIKTLLGVD
jgi:transcriptional regulator with XRE-family HTH domain